MVPQGGATDQPYVEVIRPFYLKVEIVDGEIGLKSN